MSKWHGIKIPSRKWKIARIISVDKTLVFLLLSLLQNVSILFRLTDESIVMSSKTTTQFYNALKSVNQTAVENLKWHQYLVWWRWRNILHLPEEHSSFAIIDISEPKKRFGWYVSFPLQPCIQQQHTFELC